MLDQKEVVKQVIDLQRAACGVMMSGMVTFWKQTEKTLDAFLGQGEGLSGEGKTALKEWAGSNAKGCESLKAAMDEGYKRLGKHFEAGKKS